MTSYNDGYQLDEPVEIENPVASMEKEAEGGKYSYLLAHALDGVIWGKIDGGHLSYSRKAFPTISPELRQETLLEARLFSEKVEWFLWKTDRGWRAREIEDGVHVPDDYYDERMILWGTDLVDFREGFSLLREADLGIIHAPPIEFKKGDRHQLKLTVRHYLAYDDMDAAFVKISRLAGLSIGGGK